MMTEALQGTKPSDAPSDYPDVELRHIGPVFASTADQIKSLELITGDTSAVIIGAAINGALIQLGVHEWVVSHNCPESQ